MLASIDNEEDKQLLSDWFVKDENSVPTYYLLQPIRNKLVHYADNSDQDKKKEVSLPLWSGINEKNSIHY